MLGEVCDIFHNLSGFGVVLVRVVLRFGLWLFWRLIRVVGCLLGGVIMVLVFMVEGVDLGIEDWVLFVGDFG